MLKKFLVYELIKGAASFVVCFFMFSILPFSVFIILLPLDAVLWNIYSKKIELTLLRGYLTIGYVLVTVVLFVLAIAGFQDELSFLLNPDRLFH